MTRYLRRDDMKTKRSHGVRINQTDLFISGAGENDSERLLRSSNGVSGVDLVCQGHLAEHLIVSRISKISQLPSMRDY